MSKTLEGFRYVLCIPDKLWWYTSSFQCSTQWFTSLLLLIASPQEDVSSKSGLFLWLSLKNMYLIIMQEVRLKKQSHCSETRNQWNLSWILGPGFLFILHFEIALRRLLSPTQSCSTIVVTMSCAVPGEKLLALAFTPGTELPFAAAVKSVSITSASLLRKL